MAEMPAPMTSDPLARRARPLFGWLGSLRAKPELKKGRHSEAMVGVRSYESGMGRDKASIPMKCIDQMPVPIDMAPPASHSCAEEPVARATRAARRRAV